MFLDRKHIALEHRNTRGERNRLEAVLMFEYWIASVGKDVELDGKFYSN
jgi:hypothetical protein